MSQPGTVTIVHRPIQCRYQMEINSKEEIELKSNLTESNPNDDSGHPDGDSDRVAVRQSKHAAASMA